MRLPLLLLLLLLLQYIHRSRIGASGWTVSSAIFEVTIPGTRMGDDVDNVVSSLCLDSQEASHELVEHGEICIIKMIRNSLRSYRLAMTYDSDSPIDTSEATRSSRQCSSIRNNSGMPELTEGAFSLPTSLSP